MSTTSPKPFDNVRALSSREILQRAKAVNCTLAKSSKPARSGQVDVALFFDGTGNNMETDFTHLKPPARKHSNIVKLFRTVENSIDDGRFRFYIPGFGIPEIIDVLNQGFGGAGTVHWAVRRRPRSRCRAGRRGKPDFRWL